MCWPPLIRRKENTVDDDILNDMLKVLASGESHSRPAGAHHLDGNGFVELVEAEPKRVKRRLVRAYWWVRRWLVAVVHRVINLLITLALLTGLKLAGGWVLAAVAK